VRANREVVEELLRRGAIRTDDLVIITKGDFDGREGATNVMKIVRVGDQQPD
jgi:pyruvate kinase